MEDRPSSWHDRRRHDRRQRYRVRVLCSLAASLLLVVALVRLWPVQPPPEHTAAPDLYDNEAPPLKDVPQTKQAPRRAPPPPPPAPLYATQEEIEQEPLNLTVELAPDPAPAEAPPGPESKREGPDEEDRAAGPSRAARLLSFPELTYPEAARRNGIRAQVNVEVVIAPSGRVEEATILRRVLLDEQGNPQRAVDALNYGLEEAALEAARGRLYRPARADGQPVRSRKTFPLTFKF